MINRPLVFGNLPVVTSRDNANPYPVILVFENQLLGRAGVFSASSDSEAIEGDWGANNLLTEYSYNRYRSGSVEARSLEIVPEVSVTFPLGESASIDWLSYHWSNLLVAWRADLYRGNPDTDGVLLGTTDWMHPVVKSTIADFPYPAPLLTGPTEKRIDKMAADRQLSSYCHLPTPIWGVDYIRWRFDVVDGTNGVADYLQAALMVAGRAWQSQINITRSTANLAPVDTAISRRTAAHVQTGVDRPTFSEISFDLAELTASEAMTRLFTDWVRTQPQSARIFVYQEPAPRDRIRYYDGGAFIGTREAFSGVSIDAEGGQMGDIYVSKAAKGIKIKQTA